VWRPFIEIGKRSYGIYLWHFLPLFLIRPAMPFIDPITHVVLVSAAFAFTLTIAYISYRWLEDPIRRAGLEPGSVAVVTGPMGEQPLVVAAGIGPAAGAAEPQDLRPTVRRRGLPPPDAPPAPVAGVSSAADLRPAVRRGYPSREGPAELGGS